MLREAVKRGTALGKKAKAYMGAGGLVPDELVDAMVKSRVARKDCERGFILDGYPRTTHQAEFLGKLLRNRRITIVTIGIRVGSEILKERLAGRWTCPRCGKIFNSASNPSPEGNRCDECNVPLIHRKDDSAEVVGERLQVYHRATEPLIQYYQARGCYHEVGGVRDMKEVFEALKRIVEGRP